MSRRAQILSTRSNAKRIDSLPTSKPEDEEIAESWEDELSAEEEDDDDARTVSAQLSKDPPKAPPPTLASSQRTVEEDFIPPYLPSAGGEPMGRASPTSSDRRPEKQTAVAGRLIAGALGVRAPKKTDEQRAYERAVKEKEIRRRHLEREAELRAKQQAEQAKAAIWND